MAATFNSFVTETNSNVRILYYEADRTDIEVLNVGNNTASTWASNGEYGVNGTFFSNSNFMMGFAINDGAHVFSSTLNCDGTDWINFFRPFSCAVCFDNILPNTRKILDFGVCKRSIPYSIEEDTVELSNITWGIGGINLYIGDNTITSETSLISRIKADVDAVTDAAYRVANGYVVDMTSKLARTAIGYKAPGKVVLAAFVKNSDYTSRTGAADIFDVRQIMKNELNCTFGLLLDGGSSTQISYKKDNANSSIVVSGACYCRVGLESSTSIKWNWGATS